MTSNKSKPHISIDWNRHGSRVNQPMPWIVRFISISFTFRSKWHIYYVQIHFKIDVRICSLTYFVRLLGISQGFLFLLLLLLFFFKIDCMLVRICVIGIICYNYTHSKSYLRSLNEGALTKKKIKWVHLIWPVSDSFYRLCSWVQECVKWIVWKDIWISALNSNIRCSNSNRAI